MLRTGRPTTIVAAAGPGKSIRGPPRPAAVVTPTETARAPQNGPRSGPLVLDGQVRWEGGWGGGCVRAWRGGDAWCQARQGGGGGAARRTHHSAAEP